MDLRGVDAKADLQEFLGADATKLRVLRLDGERVAGTLEALAGARALEELGISCCAQIRGSTAPLASCEKLAVLSLGDARGLHGELFAGLEGRGLRAEIGSREASA